MHKVISSVLSLDSSTVNSVIFSTDGISFIGAHGTTPTGQPTSQHKLVFKVKHYGLKKQKSGSQCVLFVERALSPGKSKMSTGNVSMLLKTNSNAMSVRKNLVQPVITKNMFFFMKKKKRSLYVMNVVKGLLILHSLTVMHKCIHLKNTSMSK